MFSGPGSGRAFSNGYLLHNRLPPILIRLHPPGTTSLSRVSRLPPLVVVSIRALLLGAVKCAKPRSCALRSDDTDAPYGVTSGPMATRSAFMLSHLDHI
jgi:hypothetical protein